MATICTRITSTGLYGDQWPWPVSKVKLMVSLMLGDQKLFHSPTQALELLDDGQRPR